MIQLKWYKRKGSKQVAKSSKYPGTQSHRAWHSVRQSLQASQVICRGGSRFTEYADTARTSRQTATLRPQDTREAMMQTGKLSTAASVPRRRAPRHTVREQNCLGRRATIFRLSHWTFTSCYAIPPRFHEATHANVYLVVIHGSILGVHHSMTGIQYYRPLSQTSLAICCVFVFRITLKNSAVVLRRNMLLWCW